MNDNITVKTTNGMTTTIFTTRDMVVEPLAELILG